MLPRVALRGLLVALVCASPLGCQHSESSPFPPGLEPLDEDTAPPPAATATDPYPETINMVPSSDDTSPIVHATAYVHAPVADVWAAFKDPNVVVDRHDVTSYSIQWNVESQYQVSFLTHYEIDKIATVEFDLTWRQGVVHGTEDAPTAVSVVYQKTFGSSYVNLMKGSVEITQVTSDVTELQFSQRMDAAETTAIDIAKWTAGMYESVVARVHGQPLP